MSHTTSDETCRVSTECASIPGENNEQTCEAFTYDLRVAYAQHRLETCKSQTTNTTNLPLYLSFVETKSKNKTWKGSLKRTLHLLGYSSWVILEKGSIYDQTYAIAEQILEPVGERLVLGLNLLPTGTLRLRVLLEGKVLGGDRHELDALHVKQEYARVHTQRS